MDWTGFVVKFNTTLTSATFGNPCWEDRETIIRANAIAVDSYTSIVIAGQTGSPNFPTTVGNLPKLSAISCFQLLHNENQYPSSL